PAHLDAVPRVPDTVEDCPVALVVGPEPIFSTEPRRHVRPRELREALPVDRLWERLFVRRQRIRGRRLPAVAETLRERRLQGVVVIAPATNAHIHSAPARINPVAEIGEGIADPGGGIVAEVDVVRLLHQSIT